jgi:hypothetical protein
VRLGRETFRTCDPYTAAGREWIASLCYEATDEPAAIHGLALIANAEGNGEMEFAWPHQREEAIRLADEYLAQFRADQGQIEREQQEWARNRYPFTEAPGSTL